MSEATTNNQRLYEGLFLFNPAQINSSVAQATEVTREILDRAHAETLALYKWDDRKLAYDIQKQKRGLYMLAYFRCATDQVAHIERDVNLSEQVMRVMMLKADHIGEAELTEAKRLEEETRTAAALQAKADAEKTEATPDAKTAEAPAVVVEAAPAAPATPATPAPAAEPAADESGSASKD